MYRLKRFKTFYQVDALTKKQIHISKVSVITKLSLWITSS
jgi:hypothetical protein